MAPTLRLFNIERIDVSMDERINVNGNQTYNEASQAKEETLAALRLSRYDPSSESGLYETFPPVGTVAG
jgi:hypothetical protein